MMMILFLLNAGFSALNAYDYASSGYPANLAVAIFCGLTAILVAIRKD